MTGEFICLNLWLYNICPLEVKFHTSSEATPKLISQENKKIPLGWVTLVHGWKFTNIYVACFASCLDFNRWKDVMFPARNITKE